MLFRDGNGLDFGRILDSPSPSDLQFLSPSPHSLDDGVSIPYSRPEKIPIF